MQYFKGFKLLSRWTMKHHSLAVDLSGLDFEMFDAKILEDEAKEQEEIEFGAMEKGFKQRSRGVIAYHN